MCNPLLKRKSTRFRISKLYAYVIVLCVFVSSNSWASSLRFKNLNVNDGLPFNSVRAIAEDKDGNIWLGTEIGLARYDGHAIKTYFPNDKNPNSIAGTYILDLEIDKHGALWVTSGEKGLSRYNRDTDDFTLFVHDPEDNSSLISNEITALKSVDTNFMWVGTSQGLSLLDITNNSSTHFKSNPDVLNSLPDNNIRALLESSNGDLYAGTGKGLALYNPVEKDFRLIQFGKSKHPVIRSIVQTSNGLIWVGTRGDGLFTLNPKTLVSKKFNFEANVNSVLSLYVDFDDNVWAGTSQHGLLMIDTEYNVLNMKPDKSDAHSLSDKTILSLHLDRSNQMWVGTYNSGVDSFSPEHLVWGSGNNTKNSYHCIPSENIRSALAISNTTILLGTLAGLTELNLADGSCKNYSNEKSNNSSISDEEVYEIFKDSSGSFWIGTNNGLDEFDRKRGEFVRFGKQIKNSTVYKIIEHQGYLFLATSGGLYKFSLMEKKALLIKNKQNELSELYVSRLNIDANGTIWVASEQGVFVLEKKLSYLKRAQIDNKPLTMGVVYSYLVDSKGIHWFSIRNGSIKKYDPILRKLTSASKQLEISNNVGISGIYETSDRFIWFATLTHGLFKYNSESKELTNFRLSDGLHSETFNYDTFTQFPDGRLFFGGKTGFNIFHPDKIKLNTSPPFVSITQLKLFGKKITPHQNYGGFTINKHISDLNELELSHREIVFGFDFVANHHLAPKKIKYYYQLEGFDKDWIETSAQNRGVTYNNISPGDYTFRLKAKTHNDVWSENDVALKIIILPAPWLTWWAFTLYGIFVIASIFLFIRYRTRALQLRAEQLKESVELKTKELVEEKDKVEQLLSRKNEEFANVSHEFRTPLTLVLGPLAQVIKKIKTEKELDRLNIVQRNGYRLLRMVDQLLNLETFRVKSITQKSPQAIGKNTKLITDAFSDLADEKNISISLRKELDINFQFTPDAYEKILLNLLSNAIKYSKSGDSITIEITRTNDNQFELVVRDTGIGIPNNKLVSIFERYNRVLDENSEQVTGAGIGLALVKELVEAHDGHINLRSELEKGTSITISLPIIGEVDTVQVNSHTNDEIVAMELMSLSSQTINQPKNQQQSININTDKPSVLIIEDNADMREYIQNSISDIYQVLTANDGKQGVELAIKEVPDLIISDIMMPKMDGYQTTNALRNNEVTNHIPIILLTARGDRESRLKGWYEKADEYLTKPFDVEELRIRLKNLLSIRDILKKRFSESIFINKKTIPLPDNKSSAAEKQDTQLLIEEQQQEFVIKLNGILENIYQDSELTIPQISKAIAMSDRQFFRKLKNVFDIAPIEYLRRFRLEKAKLLLDEGKSVNYAAIEVGFTSQSYFGRCFKAQFGVSPRDYKNASG